MRAELNSKLLLFLNVIFLLFIGCKTATIIPLETRGGIMTVDHSKRSTYVLGFSEDSKYALISELNGCVRIWDIATSQFIQTNCNDKKNVKLAVFSHDNEHFITVDDDNQIALRKTNTGALIRKFKYSSEIPPRKMEASRKGFIEEFFDKSFKKTKDYTLEALSNPEKAPDNLDSISFSNSGKQVVTTAYCRNGNFVIRIWNTETGNEIDAHYEIYSATSAKFEKNL